MEASSSVPANTTPANTDTVNTNPANTDTVNTNPANTDTVNTNPANTDTANTNPANTDTANTNTANTDTNTDTTADTTATQTAEATPATGGSATTNTATGIVTSVIPNAGNNVIKAAVQTKAASSVSMTPVPIWGVSWSFDPTAPLPTGTVVANATSYTAYHVTVPTCVSGGHTWNCVFVADITIFKSTADGQGQYAYTATSTELSTISDTVSTVGKTVAMNCMTSSVSLLGACTFTSAGQATAPAVATLVGAVEAQPHGIYPQTILVVGLAAATLAPSIYLGLFSVFLVLAMIAI